MDNTNPLQPIAPGTAPEPVPPVAPLNPATAAAPVLEPVAPAIPEQPAMPAQPVAPATPDFTVAEPEKSTPNVSFSDTEEEEIVKPNPFRNSALPESAPKISKTTILIAAGAVVILILAVLIGIFI